MVLHGAHIHRCGRAWCNLVSAQTLPYDLCRLYGRAGSLTSTDLSGVACPCSRRYRSGMILMARSRSLQLDQDVAKRAYDPIS